MDRQNSNVNSAITDFQSFRPLLFSIAYRMLGSASEAEDILQEAYLRCLQSAAEQIDAPKPYLTTIVTRLCLDQLKSARHKREAYIGTWLPEPIITDRMSFNPWENATQKETISVAFLTLLQSLSAQERAVFILHEVFDYDYQEIADVIDLNAAHCRQLFHRAKEQLQSRRPRFTATPEIQEKLLEGFLNACQDGELTAFTELLREDVILYSDGGGKTRAALRPIFGREHVTRFFMGILKKRPDNYYFTFAEINGTLAILNWSGDDLINVVTFDIVDDQIHSFHIIVNPDKLGYLKDQWSASNN